jgi:ribosomal protein S18 acetylase RimI-like enzyme
MPACFGVVVLPALSRVYRYLEECMLIDQEVGVTSPGEHRARELSTSTSSKLRPATGDDMGAILEVVVASTLFPADEVGALREAIAGVLEGKQRSDHQIAVWVDEPSGPPAGVVYVGSDPMADRKWDLWMIAVHSARQGQGIGGELLRYAEARARAGGARLLLVETSSLPKFDSTRTFYLQHGYREVARIPDFYADGDSKVVFTKRIDEQMNA